MLLYVFFLSISLMGTSFKFFGHGFAERLLATTANPFVGLFIGVLATSVVQSSSTVTAMTVGLVAGGALSIQGAIPIIIGSNLGTSVTNTLVSVGHISRPEEFRRAFAAATVHDFFNLILVVVFFPLQLFTNVLGHASSLLTEVLKESGGLQLVNPIKTIVEPAVTIIGRGTSESGALMLLIAVGLLFLSLRYLVVVLKSLVIGRIEHFFNQTLFKTAPRALVLGILTTIAVQSSSITTSLAVPLAGAGILSLMQISSLYPGRQHRNHHHGHAGLVGDRQPGGSHGRLCPPAGQPVRGFAGMAVSTRPPRHGRGAGRVVAQIQAGPPGATWGRFSILVPLALIYLAG